MRIREAISRAYRAYGVPFPKYFATRILPAGMLSFFLVLFLLPRLFPLLYSIPYAKYVLYVFPMYVIVALFVYPIGEALKRKKEIEQYIHFFITRLTVMAEAEIPRDLMIETVANDTSLGAIAEEFQKIWTLTSKWKISLAKAMRIISDEVPSKMFRDFLRRFATAIEIGEDLKDFLEKEHKVVLTEYETMYRTALGYASVLREVFIAIAVSGVFLMSFMVIIPVITGGNPTTYMIVGVMVFIMMEVLVYYFMKVILPRDELYASEESIPYDFNVKLYRLYLPLGLMGSVFSVLMIYILVPWPIFYQYWPAFISSSLVPLAIVGLTIFADERKVRNRDKYYETFVRSIGALAAASEAGLTGAIERALVHDFGELNPLIERLYKRLKMRIDKIRSWEYFIAESGSYLVKVFTRMFVHSVNAGGDPLRVSRFLSENMAKMGALRSERMSIYSNIMGVMYGLAIGVSLSMAVLSSMMTMLDHALSHVNIAGLPIKIPLMAAHFNLSIVSFLIVTIFAVHSAVSGLMLREISGGHKLNGLFHVIAIFWLSSAGYVIVQHFMSTIIGV